ncbi:DNA polymerase I [Neorickettsia risticii str. Illinois]|uniref:DNA polymerase I n=1 Tax=Neorickettsia risticii (strain Illinois) TaxID=434131 RepID=C6V5G0_NEORI|nr:DNA polymerase I [Neorickettsia risticii]ACT69623.1 DNA polymerase I [Neorickettsia risticii str. Illinois]
MSETLMIIDAYNFLFSAYFALPNLTHNELPVGAVYGFLNILLKHLRTKPEYLVVALDNGKSTFRETIYNNYKANRPPVPGNLTPQFALLRECVDVLNLNPLEIEGFEADDIIATLVRKFSKSDLKIKILSTDKDLMQLVSENVHVINPIKNRIIGVNEVKEKFGVFPTQMTDFLSLVGDTSDNIPGVPGIGVKTAAKLLNTFGAIDNFRLNEVSPARIKESLLRHHGQLTLSRKLVSLVDDINIQCSLDCIRYQQQDGTKLLAFLEKYGFKNLIPKLVKSTPKQSLHVTKSTNKINDFSLSAKYEGQITIYKNGKEIIFSTRETSIVGDLNTVQDLLTDQSIKKIFHSDNIPHPDPANESFEDLKVIAYPLNTLNTDLEYLFSHYLGETSPEAFHKRLNELYDKLRNAMFTEKVLTLYYKVDKPLINVIKHMEKNGISLDVEQLLSLSTQISGKLEEIENKIFDTAGKTFSLQSPKQLGKVLFEEMQIPVQKKLKTGLSSTDNEVLTSLSSQGYEIADYLLSWRHYIKLKTAYIDPLLLKVNPSEKKHRISTTYSTTLTLTGRLSSSNPNLQNIPREKNIRKIFTAKEGHYFLCADYSQIELRILAYIANVERLKCALASGTDLHTLTASQIFKTDKITPNLRNKAKAVNFGIVYGITNFGLSKQLAISKEEAASYIQKYFDEYPEIKSYMNHIRNQAKKDTYVKTIMNRKCPIQNINSDNRAISLIAERSAINAPIQGTAADIIRAAMVRMAQEKELLSHMVMQVHDELVFELETDAIQQLAKKIKQIMEEPHGIPLLVELKHGPNLGELEVLKL